MLYIAAVSDILPALITEFIRGRVIEATQDRVIVWEFVNPGGKVFRTHSYPHSYCPMVKNYTEHPVTHGSNSRFRLNSHGEPYSTELDPFFFA